MPHNQTLIASAGRSDWRVVIPGQASPLLRLAAAELQSAIEKSSGARLPIEYGEAGANAIALSVSGEGNEESYRVTVTPDHILIEGGGDRGALYGAYEFLEKALGALYLTPDRVYIPQRDTLRVPCGEYAFTPPLEYRVEPYKRGRDELHQARMRLNMGNCAFEGDRADLEAIGKTYPYSYGHSINVIIPEEEFDTHPEYFPLRNGRREHGHYHQRCLTHPDVLKRAIAWTKDRLRRSPGQKMIAIGQNDTYPDQPNNCLCPACRALDEREGTPMGSLLTFVNAVAEAIEPEFPGVTVTTLAYRYTRKAPKTIRPRKNVAIVLCSIECCFSHPIDAHCGANYHDGPIGTVSNDAFVEDIEAWSAISSRLFIWDYIVNFQHYLAPHPNMNALGPNMRYFLRHNACGVYPEAAHDVVGADFDGLRGYVISRLLWNPDRDAWDEAAEYLAAYLGAAAVPVMKWLRLLHERMEKYNIHLSTYRQPDGDMFPRELIARGHELFARAMALAKDDEALKEVRRMHMTVRYVDLCLYKRDLSRAEREALMEEYLSDMAALGVTGLYEGGASPDKARARLMEKLGL